MLFPIRNWIFYPIWQFQIKNKNFYFLLYEKDLIVRFYLYFFNNRCNLCFLKAWAVMCECNLLCWRHQASQ